MHLVSAKQQCEDSRLSGGADMDGALFLINQDIYRPVIPFGREDHNRSTDTSWADAWGHFKGWKRELDLSSSGHFTCSDVPLLVAAEVGYLDGFRAFKIVTTYLSAFMDLVLHLSEACLLPYLLTKANVMEKDSRTLLKYAI